MKKVVHRNSERGVGEHSWLSTRYSFSFADWYEPTRMGFGALRVINDDTIAARSGFGEHGHRDMEIITIVTSGVLTHKDSMGNIGTVLAGEVQVMSAGTGIMHAEYNNASEDLTLFQIWIEPASMGVSPRYDQRTFEHAEGEQLLVAPLSDAQSALGVHQDAYISRITLPEGGTHEYVFKRKGNGVYFFVISGEVNILDEALSPRDALGVEGLSSVTMSGTRAVDMLAIEVPL